MSITYSVEGESPLGVNELAKIGQAVATATNNKIPRNIGLAFVTAEKIRELNKRYAANDYVTDVLSFEYNTDESLGDIAICEKVAKLQAKQHSVSEKSEFSLLVIHGTLHLLGYDHQNKADTASFDQLQNVIMKSLNYEYRNFKWSH
jgi:probable rRNA maturation factor